MTSDEYDVIVIGGGSAGENVAGRCASAGLACVVIESELVGGECSYWACVPSKTMLRPGAVLAEARRVEGARQAVTGEVDVAAAFGWRDEMTAGWDDSSQVSWLEDAGVTLVRGRGRLVGTRAVEVEEGDGSTTRLRARQAVVLATGTSASLPPVPGLAESRPWTNREATMATALPARLLVVGGGAVGCEMAQAYRRLGSGVTLVEVSDRLLDREEPFASEEVARALAEDGVRVVTAARLESVERGGGGQVVAALAGGEQLEADEILVAAGRRPRTGDLGLESVGLSSGDRVEVDGTLLAEGVPGSWLYAVGDVNGRALLTHMGKYQARLAADHILGRPVTDLAGGLGPPRVTFTDPQVAAVGLTEAEARRRGLPVRVVRHPTGAVAGSSTRGRDEVGTSQLVVDDRRRVVVGATFTGRAVQELLHSATVAVVAEVELDRLWHAVPAFPTVSEVWLRLLEAYGL